MPTNTARWWGIVGGFAALFGLLAFRAARPHSTAAGLIGVGMVVGLAFAVQAVRVRDHRPVPDGEYLAAIWTLGYAGIVALTATGRSINLGDSLILYPPLGVTPLAVRLVLRDTGDPAGRARRAAHMSHKMLGWFHLAIGGLFVVSLFYILVSPLQLVPGVLHLWAGTEYRRNREIMALEADGPPW
jgi:hypothetical protein